MQTTVQGDMPPPESQRIPQTQGFVIGVPRTLLRIEGLVVLAAASTAYGEMGASWAIFALLFLVPDLSMLGYLYNRHFGAALYNAGHIYLTPALLAAVGLLGNISWAPSAALIWIAHIGFDRAVGYGLKYRTAFRHTHLG